MPPGSCGGPAWPNAGAIAPICAGGCSPGRCGGPRRGCIAAAYYQHLVRELGIETGPLTPRLSVPAASRTAARRMLEEAGWVAGTTLVGVAPGAAYGHAKRWPPARFAELIRLLWDERGAGCVLLGRPDDREAGQAIQCGARTDR